MRQEAFVAAIELQSAAKVQPTLLDLERHGKPCCYTARCGLVLCRPHNSRALPSSCPDAAAAVKVSVACK